VIKSRQVGLVRHAAHMGKMINANKFLVPESVCRKRQSINNSELLAASIKHNTTQNSIAFGT
jgi:hypothetical protein